jgi:Protein of unknown function (DUF3142)
VLPGFPLPSMSPPSRSGRGFAFALAALLGCLCVHSDAALRTGFVLNSRMAALPRMTVWAWEQREDLRNIDTQRVAVAYLDQTVTIGLGVESRERRDPLMLPEAVTLIPVVRIETARHAVLDRENRDAAVEDIARAAREPGIAALQVDFDATRSQRAFYRSLLSELRRQMPANLPLSITALASWCSYDRWLQELPIDEAVPMLFRMEPDRRRAPPDASEYKIREPLCEGSAGVSTTEPWPANLEGKRVYVFSDNGWRADSPAEVERKLP